LKRAVEGAKAVCSSVGDLRSLSQSARAAAARCLQFVSSQQHTTKRTKGPNMKTISTQARLMSLALALVTTVVVLGSTVAGMQASAESQPSLVVMEKVTIKPTSVQ
jgi:hypothetical protein